MKVVLLTTMLLVLAAAPAQARPTPIKMPPRVGPSQAAWGTIRVERTTFACGRNFCSDRVTHSTVTADAAGFWDVVECGGAIGLFVAGNALLVAKARKAGGIYKVAKRLFKSKGKIKTLQALKGFFGEVTGLAAVVKGCS